MFDKYCCVHLRVINHTKFNPKSEKLSADFFGKEISSMAKIISLNVFLAPLASLVCCRPPT